MDDSLRLCNLLKAAAACCERELNDALSEFAISHCQAMILFKIGDGKISMSDMSKQLCCHKSNITQVVSGLEKKGLVTRSMMKNDRRIAELALTAKGLSAGIRIRELLCKRATDCMGVFTQTEKRSLEAFLKKYIEKHRM